MINKTAENFAETAAGKAPATLGFVMKTFAETVEGLKVAFKKRDSRIDALERRINAAEATQMEYCGVHEAGRAYRKNHLVTHGGSVWVARCATTQRPGINDEWQLAVKKGRDAR